MRPRMKYSNSKIFRAKFRSTTRKALVPPCKIKGSQQKNKDVCHFYCMRLRSGLTIRKETGYFEKEPTKRYSLKSGSKKHEESFSAYPKASKKRSLLGVSRLQAFAASVDTLGSIQETSPLTQSCASLTTYDDQCVSFVLENGCYVINVEDSGKDQEKDKVLLRYYKSSFPASQSGDGVDGKKLMVNMSPAKDTDIWLHANDKDYSVELQRGDVSPPDQAFFVLHKKSSDFVSFECKNLPGKYIGVKDNQLALVEEKDENGNSIMFKLSKM
ncbi:interleukin-33 [Arvicanthis niloticus]|uniref:interleukin-33 n=1 Tax=Arvicanthis niloticus TaxID=61156 RepID=UPI00148625AB|nr:interleukin-33 [Arvicanthis niloticus]XP_034377173.1 interleukin-33 [Arvicanthis niloticus]XP_034377176.1 interleukin-33 [Arvicanthis niloticus]XP_034377181.1 interleukin-33 [Arvicanthis niloticus]XP_034377184.1 interleukin-33 [Arvicanthis niloticus]